MEAVQVRFSKQGTWAQGLHRGSGFRVYTRAYNKKLQRIRGYGSFRFPNPYNGRILCCGFDVQDRLRGLGR